MAQVTARKRGKNWEYRFEIASVDGKRKQKSKGGFRTKAEAMKAGTEALNKYNNTGIVTTNSQMSVADFFDLWLNEFVIPNRRPNTIRSTKTIIENHIKTEIGHYKLSGITHSTIQKMINEKSKIYAKSHIKRILAVLHSGFEYAYFTMEIIQHNPVSKIKIPENTKDTNDKIRAYTAEECQAFAEKLKDSPEGYCAFMIAFFTGMRIGEIAALTWDDVDMEKRTININKTTIYTKKKSKSEISIAITPPKTKSSSGVVPFGEELYKILRKVQIEQKENALFYGQHYLHNYAGENGQISVTNEKKPNELKFVLRNENGKICGEPHLHKVLKSRLGDEFRFHNLRHTHATLLIESGTPIPEVSERLRHSSASTTLNVYAEATERTHEISVRAIENAWTNGGQNNIING